MRLITLLQRFNGSAPAGSVLFSSLGLNAGDPFIVTAGATVLMNMDTPLLGSTSISGTVKAQGNFTLSTTGINILNGGALEYGTEAVATSAKISLTGAYVPLTGLGPTTSNPGTSRAILVQPGGRLDLHGITPTTIYTKLNAQAAAADTSLTLKDSPGWASGDDIAIAPTDFVQVGTAEQRTLASATSGTTAAISAGLGFARWGVLQYPIDTPAFGSGMSLTQGTFTAKKANANVPIVLDQRARVANLTRGVVISSPNDTDWSVKGHGATIMWMASGTLIPLVRIEGVQIRRGGQRGALGRYPFHAHMNSYTSATGAFTVDTPLNYVRKCVVWDSENRGYTIHGTNGMTWDDNIGLNCKGHSFFLEDGSERRNTFRRNMMFNTRAGNTNAVFMPGTFVSASGNGTIATVNWTAHGLYSGECIDFNSKGGVTAGFNLFRVPVTVITANQFTYPCTATGAAAMSNVVRGDDSIKLHDRQPAGYWITNMDNVNEYNYASGAADDYSWAVEGAAGQGMWLALATQCFGLSSLVAINPSTIAVNSFKGFEGHSNRGVGMRLRDPPSDEAGNLNIGVKYFENLGTVSSTDHILWKNAMGGYFNLIGNPVYERWTTADNGGTDFSGGVNTGGIARHHLLIGTSLNNATSPVTIQTQRPRAGFATYHGTLAFTDLTAINFPFAAIAYNNAADLGFGGGVFEGGSDFYDEPGVAATDSFNTNVQLINSHYGAMCPPIHLDGRSVDTAGQFRHWSIASVVYDGLGKYGTAGRYMLPLTPATGLVDDYFLSGAASPADGPTSGTVVCKTTTTRYFGMGWADALQNSTSSGIVAGGMSSTNLSPVTCTRQNPSTGATIGTPFLIKRGDNSSKLNGFHSWTVQSGARYSVDFNDDTFTTPIPTSYSRHELCFITTNQTGDFVLLGLPWANASVPRVAFGQAKAGTEIGSFPGSADVTANRALICSTSGASIAAALADTTGNTYFRDTTNNRLWVRFTVPATPFPTNRPNGNYGIYETQMIYIKV